MSAEPSLRRPPFGIGPARARRLPAVLLGLFAVLSRPGAAVGQIAPTYPLLSFRERLELQALPEASQNFLRTPSLRVTLEERATLKRSTIYSGMILLDPLSHSVAFAAGQMLTFGHTRLIEPFAEVGASFSDARVPDGRYEVVGSGGRSLRMIHRYQTLREPAALAGAGVSWSGMIGNQGSTPVRITLGYWELAGMHRFSDGSLRFGVSLGWARRDPRWYSLASDRTPPRVVIVGRGVARLDSVEVTDGQVRILAADAVGIARIRVDGAKVAFGPADSSSALRFGLGGDVVAATVVVLQPPFDGRQLDVAVQDSAGLTTHVTVWAFAAPAHAPQAASGGPRRRGVEALDPRAGAHGRALGGTGEGRAGGAR